MTGPALSSRPDRQTPAAIVARGEQRVAEQEADLMRVSEQRQDREADLQQARLLLAYLRRKLAEMSC